MIFRIVFFIAGQLVFWPSVLYGLSRLGETTES